MINFIIYEDSINTIKLYKSIINNFIGTDDNNYNIITFTRYNTNFISDMKHLLGKKIYILDICVPGKNGLDLARDIRDSGDWLSQIIIISEFDKYQKESFTSKILTLDFIHKDNNFINLFTNTLNLAYKIINTHKYYTYQHNGNIYQIPYHDILYFEKDLNDNYSSIITINNKYKVKESITNIEKKLATDLRFFKMHRSCIINLYNVRSVEIKNSNIVFIDNHSTTLLSRNYKKQLKEKLTSINKNF